MPPSSRMVLAIAVVLSIGLLAGLATVDDSYIEDARVVDATDDDGDGYVSGFGIAVEADTECVGCNDESENSPDIEPYFRFYVDRGDGFTEIDSTDVVRNDPNFRRTFRYSRFTGAKIDTAAERRIRIRIELWDRDVVFGEKIDQTTLVVDVESPASDENAPPSAEFSVDPRIGKPGPSVVFDASGSSDPDAPLQGYRWDFDGDGEVDATGETVRRTFDRPGRRQVRLVVVDAAGATDAVTRPVSVAYDTDGDFLRDSRDPYPTMRTQPIGAVVVTALVVTWFYRRRIARGVERIARSVEQFDGSREGSD